MPRASPLPQRLRYLSPIRKHLAALPPEELNEDLDIAVFVKALRKRTKGLSLEEATTTLQGDRTILEDWLARPERSSDPLHFFYGFLLIAADSVEELLKAPDKHPPLGELQMEFPKGARTKRYPPGLEIRLGEITLSIFPSDKESFEVNIETLRLGTQLEKSVANWVTTPIAFGGVSGYKFVREANAVSAKEVHYELEVPGGYASACIVARVMKWTESEFEQCLRSIKIVYGK
jgi:hypothetical protein